MVNMVDEFILYDDMQYTTRDWRNRNKIKTPTGTSWLVIPVRHDSRDQKINESVVSEAKWAIKHWRSIAQTYAKAPFFKQYKDELEAIYLNPGSDYLSLINHRFIQFVCKELGINTKISWSSDYTLVPGKTERLVQLVLDAGGTEYLSGPAAQDYIVPSVFADAGVKLEWMDYSGYPEYQQLGPAPFEHGVTALDLLFNTGSEAPRFMKSFASSDNPA
ncbi:WbqC family protein [Microvirga sp. STS02]|uniref:WbqC family protein n=2 Tax=Hymenobacter negativus TaxID=2795026 RepID=A0ABS0Q4N3_9BACT|nr:WbqC family protein [Hymenobacter negativus]MBH8567840.1 WbqC family protein [Hymenobacter negativus]MBR7207576.1 WbqC family protein [Microvirga sp. STS02]